MAERNDLKQHEMSAWRALRYFIVKERTLALPDSFRVYWSCIVDWCVERKTPHSPHAHPHPPSNTRNTHHYQTKPLVDCLTDVFACYQVCVSFNCYVTHFHIKAYQWKYRAFDFIIVHITSNWIIDWFLTNEYLRSAHWNDLCFSLRGATPCRYRESSVILMPARLLCLCIHRYLSVE